MALGDVLATVMVVIRAETSELIAKLRGAPAEAKAAGEATGVAFSQGVSKGLQAGGVQQAAADLKKQLGTIPQAAIRPPGEDVGAHMARAMKAQGASAEQIALTLKKLGLEYTAVGAAATSALGPLAEGHGKATTAAGAHAQSVSQVGRHLLLMRREAMLAVGAVVALTAVVRTAAQAQSDLQRAVGTFDPSRATAGLEKAREELRNRGNVEAERAALAGRILRNPLNILNPLVWAESVGIGGSILYDWAHDTARGRTPEQNEADYLRIEQTRRAVHEQSVVQPGFAAQAAGLRAGAARIQAGEAARLLDVGGYRAQADAIGKAIEQEFDAKLTGLRGKHKAELDKAEGPGGIIDKPLRESQRQAEALVQQEKLNAQEAHRLESREQARQLALRRAEDVVKLHQALGLSTQTEDLGIAKGFVAEMVKGSESWFSAVQKLGEVYTSIRDQGRQIAQEMLGLAGTEQSRLERERELARALKEQDRTLADQLQKMATARDDRERSRKEADARDRELIARGGKPENLTPREQQEREVAAAEQRIRDRAAEAQRQDEADAKAMAAMREKAEEDKKRREAGTLTLTDLPTFMDQARRRDEALLRGEVRGTPAELSAVLGRQDFWRTVDREHLSPREAFSRAGEDPQEQLRHALGPGAALPDFSRSTTTFSVAVEKFSAAVGAMVIKPLPGTEPGVHPFGASGLVPTPGAVADALKTLQGLPSPPGAEGGGPLGTAPHETLRPAQPRAPLTAEQQQALAAGRIDWAAPLSEENLTALRRGVAGGEMEQAPVPPGVTVDWTGAANWKGPAYSLAPGGGGGGAGEPPAGLRTLSQAMDKPGREMGEFSKAFSALMERFETGIARMKADVEHVAQVLATMLNDQYRANYGRR